MLEISTATEGGLDYVESPREASAKDRSVREEFETIWRIAGLPASHLNRYADGSYKAAYATRAWDMYVATRKWQVVLAAAKSHH